MVANLGLGFAQVGLSLWKLPASSTDPSPVEKYWSWLRHGMRSMDLADLAAKRPALGKIAWKARLMRVVRAKAAKQVAGNTLRNLKAVCAIVKKTGAASGT